MMGTRNTLLLLLACAACALADAAISATPAPLVGDQSTINGIAIVPGVERLSYISDEYYGVRPSYSECVRETQGRIVDQGDCADTEFSYQDGRLDKAYKTLTGRLVVTDKQAAVDAQRAWLAFFAKDCAARAARFGSDNAPATESTCRMKSTAARAQQLEDWLSSLTTNPSY